MRGIALALCVLCSCSRPSAGERVEIVVTTSILGDAVREIVREDVPVRVLMGPGVDPHLFRPTPQDVEALQQARCIVAHGLRLEGRMQEVFRAMAHRRALIFAAELVPPDVLRQLGERQYDPHLWHSVRLWRMVVERLSDTLAVLFPHWGQQWRQRAQEYGQRLERLDAWIRAQVEQIPQEQRVLVTVHDAFAYFGREYGVETLSLQGISTAAELGLRDMMRVAEVIVRRRLPAVFVESTIPARFMENVVQMARQQGASVRLAGELYSDALGAPGSGAETYEGMMRVNVQRIVDGLRGEVHP